MVPKGGSDFKRSERLSPRTGRVAAKLEGAGPPNVAAAAASAVPSGPTVEATRAGMRQNARRRS